MHLEKVMGEISPKINLKLRVFACCYGRVMRSQWVTVTDLLYKNIYKDHGLAQNTTLKEKSHGRLYRAVPLSRAKRRRTTHEMKISSPLMLRFKRVSVL